MPNPFIYLMFHPVVYMVKLNIEMTMASLIWKLARVPSWGQRSLAARDTAPSELSAP